MPRPYLAAVPILLAVGLLAAQPANPPPTLRGHTAGVFNVTYSPDGKVLATAGKDRQIRLWDRAGKEVARLEGHTGDVYRVLFSPDGQLLASASTDQTVRLWGPREGRQLQVLPGGSQMFNLAFAPDGKVLAGSGGDGKIRFWEVPAGKLVHTLNAHSERCLGLAYSPDGKLLATSCSPSGNEVVLWDTATWKEVRRLGGGRGVMALAFSPDGLTVAAGCTDQSVRLWEVFTGQEVLKLDGHTNATYFVAFSPDGTRLASCGGDWNKDKPSEVIVWDAHAGTAVETVGEYPHTIWSLAFAPDGREVATACGKWSGNVPGEVRLVSLADLKAEAVVAATPEQLARWWADLHDADAGKAYRAGWALSRAGAATLALMAERVKPVPAVSAEQIARWIRDLDDDDFDVREAATLALEQQGARVRGALTTALQSPAIERRRRARDLLDRITGSDLSIEEIQALRELAVLSRLGAPARPLVERYTRHADGTAVGIEARRVLQLIRTP